MKQATFEDFGNGDEHGTAGNMSQAMSSVLVTPVLWLMCQS